MKKTKIAIVGNCQSRPMAKIMTELSNNIEITSIAIVHLLHSKQFHEYEIYFKEADFIIAQQVNDNYPCEFVRTNFLKTMYGDKVITVINLYFTGYNPDWLYKRVEGKGPLKGPMGDYQNETIIDSWKNGISAQSASELLENFEHNQHYLYSARSSLEELRARDKLTNISICDFIESKYRKKRLFYTFNHPSTYLLHEYCKRIIKFIGIRRKFILSRFKDTEYLDQFSPLTNPALGLPNGKHQTHKGVCVVLEDNGNIKLGKTSFYTSYELVKRFYDTYDYFNKIAPYNEVLR